MSNYTKTTNFSTKDALPSGNPAKIVKGTEIDTEFNNIATAVATKSNSASPTFTGTLTAPVVTASTSLNIAGDGATVTGIKDEDDMASNSATKLATQQSIKAYVDSQVTAQDLDVTDGTTSISIDLDSEALSLLGGTGIDSTASGNSVTMAIDSTVATLTGTQTLTNKTLTSPDVNTPDIDGGTIDGTVIGGTTAAAGSFTTVGATGNITVGGTVDGRDVATDGTKLDGIEAGATADQTAAEIKTAYESNANTNAFTDADESKLDGIEALADVTDTANVTAAGALMDSELTSIASVKALDQGVATTDSPSFAGLTASGEITANGGIALGDNDKATFGAGDDLQIYHDPSGPASYISDVGNGDLIIKGSNQIRLQQADGDALATFNEDGSVQLYYDNAEKLSTTATGIDVTGTATMDGLLVETGTASNAGTLISTDPTILFSMVDSGGSSQFRNVSGAYSIRTGGDAGATTNTKQRALFASNGDISFYEDTGTTPKFFWDASAESLGIGTSSPQSGLHVVKGVADVLRLERDASNQWQFQLTVGALAFRDSTSNQERMRIDSAGNVGIGATSANSSRLRLDNGGTSGAPQLMLTATGASTQTEIRHDTSNNLIFDNWNSGRTERMRIDSAGNVLVGKSATGFGTAGIELRSNGELWATTGVTNSASFNRTGSYGAVITINSANNPVGSIGVEGSRPYFANDDTGGFSISSAGYIIPATSTGAVSDATKDLGISGARFKDLYLSGGVYLGGTGAANHLDDYEEGTFTPNIAFGGASVGVTYFAQQGNYTKVGRLVQATGKLYVNAVGSSTGDFTITGLPFALSASANSDTAVAIRTDAVSYADVPAAFIIAGTSYITFTETTNAGTGSNLTNANIAFGSTITFTASYFV